MYPLYLKKNRERKKEAKGFYMAHKNKSGIENRKHGGVSLVTALWLNAIKRVAIISHMFLPMTYRTMRLYHSASTFRMSRTGNTVLR